jgi:hypothetical protein
MRMMPHADRVLDCVSAGTITTGEQMAATWKSKTTQKRDPSGRACRVESPFRAFFSPRAAPVCKVLAAPAVSTSIASPHLPLLDMSDDQDCSGLARVLESRSATANAKVEFVDMHRIWPR